MSRVQHFLHNISTSSLSTTFICHHDRAFIVPLIFIYFFCFQAGVSRSTWVGIKVLDENDWNPEWKSVEYQGAVLESAKPGDPVFLVPSFETPSDSREVSKMPSLAGREQLQKGFRLPSIKELEKFEHLAVKAVDRDAGSNGRVHYSSPAGSPASQYFQVDSVTGETQNHLW